MQADAPAGGIAILGAGLAGLSLAVQLVERGVRAPITLVEPRTAYADDRTWGFWETEAHPFSPLIAERWHAWRVAAGGREIVRGAGVPYARLPAAALYADARARLAGAANVRLLTGTRVTGLDGGRVLTDRGPLDGAVVYDGRPPEADRIVRGPRLLQQFVGRRVTTDRPVFEPGVADLMDFRVSQRHGIAFLYVLPSGPREALVEATVFAGEPVSDAVLDGLLADGLAARAGGARVAVLGEERGEIPMAPGLGALAGDDGRAIPIGTRAGAPRGSTGYAFLPVQRHVRQLADDLAAGRPRARAMRGTGTDWLDRVFLTQLLRDPAGGPALLARLFDRVPPARLVRFLMEQGGPLDHLAVMTALPTAPLLRSALLVGWRRAAALSAPAGPRGPACPACPGSASGRPWRTGADRP
jgi:lycopene beta-cyclase